MKQYAFHYKVTKIDGILNISQINYLNSELDIQKLYDHLLNESELKVGEWTFKIYADVLRMFKACPGENNEFGKTNPSEPDAEVRVKRAQSIDGEMREVELHTRIGNPRCN